LISICFAIGAAYAWKLNQVFSYLVILLYRLFLVVKKFCVPFKSRVPTRVLGQILEDINVHMQPACFQGCGIYHLSVFLYVFFFKMIQCQHFYTVYQIFIFKLLQFSDVLPLAVKSFLHSKLKIAWKTNKKS